MLLYFLCVDLIGVIMCVYENDDLLLLMDVMGVVEG